MLVVWCRSPTHSTLQCKHYWLSLLLWVMLVMLVMLVLLVMLVMLLMLQMSLRIWNMAGTCREHCSEISDK